jgi:hypothetical protein
LQTGVFLVSPYPLFSFLLSTSIGISSFSIIAALCTAQALETYRTGCSISNSIITTAQATEYRQLA